MNNCLIINTANDVLEMVLKKGDKVYSKYISSLLHHNETMLPTLDDLLKETQTDLSEIEEYGVVIGPGSFTGIRVGISTIKAFRDSFNTKAKGINNLDYLFECAKASEPTCDTVAILGSRNSYFVAKVVNGILYKYEHNLTKEELIAVAGTSKIGMFKAEEDLNCFEVTLSCESLIKVYNQSKDETLMPIYYQLSQAENDKLKKQNLVIREAKLCDLIDVSRIERENISSNILSEQEMENIFANPSYTCFVATLNERVVGFAIYQASDELNLTSIAVEKQYRNMGLATKLIEQMKEIAKAKGLSTLSLEVSDKNISAYLLYKKMGFVLRRERKNYYQDGSNGLEMYMLVD